jgi:hypothetical protein
LRRDAKSVTYKLPLLNSDIEHEQMREEARAFNNPNSQNNTSGFNQTMNAKKSPGYSSLERTMNIPKLGFAASPMVMSPLAQSGAA